MKAYPIQHPAVHLLGRLKAPGLYIPHLFFEHITETCTIVKPPGNPPNPDKPSTKPRRTETVTEKVTRPHLLAINLMAEILHWYQPVVIEDEEHPERKRYGQKFKADKLQLSHDAVARKFGVSKHQAREASKRLVALGLIKTEPRTIELPDGTRLGNILFVEPVIPAVQQLLLAPLTDQDELLDLTSEASPSDTDNPLISQDDLTNVKEGGERSLTRGPNDRQQGVLTNVKEGPKRSLATDTDLHTDPHTDLTSSLCTVMSSPDGADRPRAAPLQPSAHQRNAAQSKARRNQPGELPDWLTAAIFNMNCTAFHCLAEPHKLNEDFWNAQLDLLQTAKDTGLPLNFRLLLSECDAWYVANRKKWPLSLDGAQKKMGYSIRFAITKAQQHERSRSTYA